MLCQVYKRTARMNDNQELSIEFNDVSLEIEYLFIFHVG